MGSVVSDILSVHRRVPVCGPGCPPYSAPSASPPLYRYSALVQPPVQVPSPLAHVQLGPHCTGTPPIPDMFKFVEIEPHCTETIHYTCDMLKLVQYVACTARKPASWHSTEMPSCLKQTAANAIRSVSLQ